MKRVTVNNETYNSPDQDYYWLDADTYFDIQDNIDLGGNQTLVQYLSTGSTYYDTTSNKSYILGADHQWIEIF